MVILFCLFFGIMAQTIYAWNPAPQVIEEQVPQTAFAQAQEFQNAARPEYSSYTTAGIIYLPLPSQSSLATEWGIHNGFAMRQRLGLWLTYKPFGFGWFGERQGWDTEDFLFIPHRGNFSQINQVHSFGLTVADSSKHLLFGSGLQYLNASDNTFRWWLLGTWNKFSAMPNFHKGELQFINAQFNLQARELRGDAYSWQNYLPDLETTLFSKDSVKMFISQNVFKQKFYVESSFWIAPASFAWLALKFYPEPSRLLLALEATATKDDEAFYFGGGLILPFLRVAYNHSNDYETFFKSRGVWIIELRFAIGTSGDSFFALNAPKAAPSEISEKSVRKSKFETQNQ
jgi:hypothetical protein